MPPVLVLSTSVSSVSGASGGSQTCGGAGERDALRSAKVADFTWRAGPNPLGGGGICSGDY